MQQTLILIKHQFILFYLSKRTKNMALYTEGLVFVSYFLYFIFGAPTGGALSNIMLAIVSHNMIFVPLCFSIEGRYYKLFFSKNIELSKFIKSKIRFVQISNIAKFLILLPLIITYSKTIIVLIISQMLFAMFVLSYLGVYIASFNTRTINIKNETARLSFSFLDGFNFILPILMLLMPILFDDFDINNYSITSILLVLVSVFAVVFAFMEIIMVKTIRNKLHRNKYKLMLSSKNSKIRGAKKFK